MSFQTLTPSLWVAQKAVSNAPLTQPPSSPQTNLSCISPKKTMNAISNIIYIYIYIYHKIMFSRLLSLDVKSKSKHILAKRSRKRNFLAVLLKTVSNEHIFNRLCARIVLRFRFAWEFHIGLYSIKAKLFSLINAYCDPLVRF